jgi:hypothetical protein
MQIEDRAPVDDEATETAVTGPAEQVAAAGEPGAVPALAQS